MNKFWHKFKEGRNNGLKRSDKILLGIAFTILFLILFIISVAGGLRVLFPYMGEISGFPFASKNYLIVFQNNTELRPAGGFISSFGLAKFQNGLFKGLDLQDVYGAVDEHPYLDPPYPMKELLANQWYKGYTFRDGNYDANFPSTAKELTRLFQITNPNTKIDGVIAVNFSLIEDLLEVTGPVKIEGKEYNKDNIFENLENDVNNIDRHNVEDLKNRKSILKPLSNELIKKILFNPFKLRKISDTVTLSLAKKDLQLYFENPSLERLIQKENWSGAWPEKFKGDFLAVVEANLGGMKSDRYIQRNILYKVTISEAALAGKEPIKARVEMNIKHYGIENIPLSGPYTGYIRFYSSPQNNIQADEIIKMMPGTEKNITKEYELDPKVIANKEYNLFIPKQSGTDDYYTLIIELPRGYTIQTKDFDAKENIAIFEGKLTRDQEFKLQIIDDKNPPRLILQELKEMGKVSIHFNEDLSPEEASDPFNYEITDLDANHPEKTDQLKIKKVVTTSKDIDIYLDGMTNQPEEHYGVNIKNLRDTHGNRYADRQVTVVQRLE